MDRHVFLVNEYAEPNAVHIVSRGRSRVLPILVVGSVVPVYFILFNNLPLGNSFDLNFR